MVGWLEKLETATARLGATFVDYQAESGTWIFTVSRAAFLVRFSLVINQVAAHMLAQHHTFCPPGQFRECNSVAFFAGYPVAISVANNNLITNCVKFPLHGMIFFFPG